MTPFATFASGALGDRHGARSETAIAYSYDARAVAWSALPLLVIVPFVHAGMGPAGERLALVSAALFLAVVAWVHPSDLRASLKGARSLGGPLALLAVVQLVPLPPVLVRWLAPWRGEMAAAAVRTQFYPVVPLTRLGVEGDVSTLVIPAREADLWRGQGEHDTAPWYACLVVDPWRTARGWVRLAIWLLITCGFAAACRRQRTRRQLLVIMTVSAAALALFSALTRVTRVGAAVLSPSRSGMADPIASFVNRNHFATFCLLSLGVVACLGWTTARQGFLAVDRDCRNRRVAQIAAVGLVGLLLMSATLFSKSRAGVVLVLLQCLALVTVFWRVAGSRWARITLVVAIGGSGLAALAMERARFMERFLFGLRPGYRLDASVAALEVFLRFPLAGVGFGNVDAAMEVLGLQPIDQVYGHVHNEYLQWVASTGLLGLILPLMAVARLDRGRIGAIRRDPGGWCLGIGLAAVLAHSFVDFPLQTNSVAVAASGVLGLLIGRSWRDASYSVVHR